MEILISFTTTVGVVEALRAIKDVAVDVVNQSIVLWLKNKKIPNPGQPDRPVNNREVNRRTPPYLGVGKYAYITSRTTRYDYKFYRSSWNWWWEEYSGTETGSYYYYVFAEGLAGQYIDTYRTPPGGPTGGGTYRVLASSYTSGSGSFSSYYEYNNQVLAAPPSYDSEGNITGGEPPGTMLWGLGNGFQFSSVSVSFGD
jgi:hypothetical protein